MQPLFEIESAKKRPSDDEDVALFEPMRASGGRIRRNPSTDQKKVRRQQQVKTAATEHESGVIMAANSRTAAAGWFLWNPEGPLALRGSDGRVAFIYEPDDPESTGDNWVVMIGTTPEDARQVDAVESLDMAKSLGEGLLNNTIVASRRSALPSSLISRSAASITDAIVNHVTINKGA